MSMSIPFLPLLERVFDRKRVWRCLLFACLPAGLLYAASLLVLRSLGFETMEILRDPAQQSGASSFLGYLSNLGVWLWVSATAISGFGAVTMAAGRWHARRELLVLAGLFSMILAVDDFFLLHDRYIDQRILYATYALVAALLLLRHHRSIVEIDGFAYLLAMSLLALSVGTDLVQYVLPLPYAHSQIFEEGFKFLGAATWLYFCGRVAAFALIGDDSARRSGRA